MAAVAARKRRRGLLFTLDALLASMLLLGALIVILTAVPETQQRTQTTHYAQDAMVALSVITVEQLNDTEVQGWIADGNITNPDSSILHQIGAFWATNDTVRAEALAEKALASLLPSESSVRLRIGDDLLFEQNSSATETETARSVGRRMITGVQEGSALEGTASTAYLKRVVSKETSSFAYFGGFFGQGAVTVRLDGLPDDLSNETVTAILIEGEFGDDFTVNINDVSCSSGLSRSAAALTIVRYNLTNCSSLLVPGNNTVTIDFAGSIANSSVSGGFFKVSYTTEELAGDQPSGRETIFLPDIDGVINLYDGFVVHGTLENLTLTVHYWVTPNATLPLYFDIGNMTIFSLNTTGEQIYTFDNAYLSALLDYGLLSNTTVPYRFGFYEGDTVESSGNLSDVFLLTSRHNSMSTNDIVVTSTTNVTRMVQAKVVDNLSVEILLNATGNRVGLVSFGTGASIDLDATLTNDSAHLYHEINEYSAHPTDAQRYLCGAMKTAKAQLVGASGTGRKRAIILMTDGDLQKSSGNTAICSGSPTTDRAKIWADAVRQACNFTDVSNGNPYNVTFYTVAFGPNATNDPAIVANLTLMANCTGGKFASGNNASEIEEIYRQFAAELAASSIVYSFQRATSSKNVESHLFNDSSFDLVFAETPAPVQNRISVTFQTPQFGTCTPTITIPENLEVTAAQLVSYSGDFWTKTVSVDGTLVYDLTRYDENFTDLGDPFRIAVPPQLLDAGDHTFSIVLGANASDDRGCSSNDSLIYTAFFNASTSRTIVLPNATGCNWTIEFDDGTTANLPVPASYIGVNNCSYTNGSVSYDPFDAYDAAVAALFASLDPDGDGRLLLNFAAEDLEIVVTIVQGVPYLWGPSIATLEVGR